jgi:hypothetical protein
VSAIPFTAYDIFAYLSSGFFVIASADLAFPGNWIVNAQLSAIRGVVWIVVAYITGHVIAQISATLLEKQFVAHHLHPPEESLFDTRTTTRWRLLFPGYFEAMPEEIRDLVRERAKAEAEIGTVGRGLFYYCDAKARKEPAAATHLTIFLGMYGFARNVCVAAIVGSGLLFVGALTHPVKQPVDHEQVGYHTKYWLAGAALVTAGFLLYRYLKFLRIYALEVFTAYAALDPLSSHGRNESGSVPQCVAPRDPSGCI